MNGRRLVFSGSAHPELCREICDILGIAVGRSRVVRFSNENMMVQIEDNVREADVFVIQPSCAPVSDGIVELLITMDALRHASAKRVTAVLPYFPYVRSDKKDQPRISITARLMADLVQTAGADRVLTMDLKSPQSTRSSPDAPSNGCPHRRFERSSSPIPCRSHRASGWINSPSSPWPLSSHKRSRPSIPEKAFPLCSSNVTYFGTDENFWR